jgi:hypothetical protein
MLDDANGKLLVYASSIRSHGDRLQSVSSAVERMASVLRFRVEVVRIMEKNAPIYVYYKNGEEEAVPIYCDRNGESQTEDICAKLRNMMFVLSFHPKNSILKHLRKEIIRFS